MSVLARQDKCPHTSLEINPEQYYELLRREDPVTLTRFRDIRQPVVIGTDLRQVYELDDLLRITEREARVGNRRGMRDFLNTEAVNPTIRNQKYKVSNILALHYNFDDGSGRNINNDDTYISTEETLLAYTKLNNEQREEVARNFSFVPPEGVPEMNKGDLYPIVENFLNDFIESDERKKREMVYAKVLIQVFRNYIWNIDRDNTIFKQSDGLLLEVFNLYASKNKLRMKSGVANLYEYSNAYYILNPIDMYQVVQEFCMEQQSVKVWTASEIIAKFKAYMLSQNIEFKDLSDRNIISYFDLSANMDECSQHLVIEREPNPVHVVTGEPDAPLSYIKMYHVGRNIAPLEESIQRRATRRNPPQELLELREMRRRRRRRDGYFGGGIGEGRNLSPPPAHDPNRESTVPIDDEDTQRDVQARARFHAAMDRRMLMGERTDD